MKTLNAFVLALCATSLCHAADQAIGTVTTPAKRVTAAKGSSSRTLSMGDAFFAGDQIVIGADERRNVQFTLTDKTQISCAPNSVFNVSDYQFQEKPSDTLVAKLSQGGCRILAGNIDRADSKGQRWHTPTAVMGLAGTLVGIQVQKNETTVAFFQGNGHLSTNKEALDLGIDGYYDFASASLADKIRGQLSEPKLLERIEVVARTVDRSDRMEVNLAILREHIVLPLTEEELLRIKEAIERNGNFKGNSILRLEEPEFSLKGEGLMCN